MNAQAEDNRWLALPAGPLKRLHIDKAALSAGSPEPIVIRLEDGSMIHARALWWEGESCFRFEPGSPLQPGGTYAWIETYARLAYLPA